MQRIDQRLVPVVDAREFSSLQAALDAAGNLGVDVDVVGQGNLAVSTTLTIPGKVRLLRTTIVVTGSPDGSSAAVKLNGDGAAIEGCRLTLAAGAYYNGILHNADNTVSRGCVIRFSGLSLADPTTDGTSETPDNLFYAVRASPAGSLLGVVIEGNDIAGTAKLPNGVVVARCPGVRVVSNCIHDLAATWGVGFDKDQCWGIYLGAGCQDGTADGNTLSDIDVSGIHSNSESAGASADKGRRITRNTIRDVTYHPLAVEYAQGPVVQGNAIYRFGNPILVNQCYGAAFTGNTVRELIASDYASNTTMVSVAGGSGNNVGGNTISDRGDAVFGISCSAADTTVVGNTFGRNRPRQAILIDTSGVRSSAKGNDIADTDDTTVANCIDAKADDATVENNKVIHQSAIASAYGVRVSGSRVRVSKNRIKSQRGVFVAAGTGAVLEDNDLSQVASATLITDSGTSTVKRRNDGYVTANSGVTSAADGGTIAHGLVATPTRYGATPTVGGEMASVTAVGSANLTIAIKKPDGSAGTTQNIAWWAEV